MYTSQTYLKRKLPKRKANRRAMCQLILDFIVQFTACHKRTPKQAEIAEGIYSARATVGRYVQHLLEKGYLEAAAPLQGGAYNFRVMKAVYRIPRKENRQ